MPERGVAGGGCVDSGRVSDADIADLEARCEFERQQFQLYETRRLATETHANAVIAAALVITAIVLTDYSRADGPAFGWLLVALVGLVAAFGLALHAREITWQTPPWRGGTDPDDLEAMALATKAALEEIRDRSASGVELRRQIHRVWQARARSAHRYGEVKSQLVRIALVGFVGPLIYFAGSLLG